ncbi:MAG: thiamine pyrophosphate-dependent dehydrogenase E1 component subunit alpha [Candidatus Pelagibacter sp.]
MLDHSSLPKIKNYKGISLSGITPKLSLKLYTNMMRIRLCEEELEREYHPADQMRCPVHFCTGEEAVPASLIELLESRDYLYSHHRSHGYYLAKKAPMKRLFAELYGKNTGANAGIAGSQDISFPQKNFFSGAILSGATSIAVGSAIALKMKNKNKNIVIAGFGDAATDEGVFWESLNYAGLKKLPIIFICENNNYSTFSPQKNRQSGLSISEKAKSFGVNSKAVFGNDVAKVYKILKDQIINTREGKGPFLLETFTYRYSGHVGPLSDEFKGYRPQKELNFWKNNCPIKLLETYLKKNNLINNKKVKKIKKVLLQEIKDSFKFAKKSKFPKLKNWRSLNYSDQNPLAKKLLKKFDRKEYNVKQKIILPKGY